MRVLTRRHLLVFGTVALLLLALGSLPAFSQPNARFFSETGHTLKGRFLTFWSDNGGLRIFGYPLTEEFQEVSATDGKTYLVQYLERAVFELHPENSPPDDVQLALLGRYQLEARYPNNSNPAAPPIPTTVTATPTPAAQPTNTSPPPAPTNSPLPPPAYVADAEIDPPSPHVGDTVRVVATLYDRDQPVKGATMRSTFNFATVKVPCDGGKTNDKGVAICATDITQAVPGREVRVDVVFYDDANNVLASTQVAFTPH